MHHACFIFSCNAGKNYLHADISVLNQYGFVEGGIWEVKDGVGGGVWEMVLIFNRFPELHFLIHMWT